MERKLSLQISLQRNERVIKLVVVSVVAVVLLCYCLQLIIFLLPLLYPGYNTVKVLQVLPTSHYPLPTHLSSLAICLFRLTA